MYLSRLQLNSHGRAVWREVIEHPYKLHQLVMKGFPDGVRREDAHILHRLDQQENSLTLLVQSTLPPDWQPFPPELLQERNPFDPLPNPAVQNMGDMGLTLGRTLRFRLRANPTKRLSSGKGNKPGPRVELYKQEDQLNWLHQRATPNGFQLLTADILPQGKETDWVKRPEKSHKLTLFTVQYEGLLRITDPTAFHTALTHGLGPAKAFGCGLLSLAPA